MKKIICLLCVCLAVMFAGCAKEVEVATKTMSVELFFGNSASNGLMCESRKISSDEDIAQSAITELLKGPNDESLVRLIPKGTKLLDLKIKNRCAGVYLSENFYLFSDALTQTLATYSIVDTICSTGEADDIEIFIGGKALLDFDGKPVGKMHFKSDFSKVENKINVALYLPNKNLKLQKCNRKITKTENLERAVMNELIRGSDSDELLNPLPPDTALIDIYKENNTCTVNLSREFLTSEESCDTATKIYSIVNSLTSLDGIDEVMFLVDGEFVEYYDGFELNVPFEFNSSLVAQ